MIPIVKPKAEYGTDMHRVNKYSPFCEPKGDCRIIFTNGVFDIIHRGHVRFLKQAKALGDFLCVALNTDHSAYQAKGRKPINYEMDRYEVVKALKPVDYVVLFAQPTPEFCIQCLPFTPNVIVKGGDYKPEEVITGGIKEVVIIPYEDGYSTSGIIEKIRKG